MVQENKTEKKINEKLQDIEYLKKLVDDIYGNSVFNSFHLYTLELTRRFNDSYRQYKKRKTPENLHNLWVITSNLDKKIQKESF